MNILLPAALAVAAALSAPAYAQGLIADISSDEVKALITEVGATVTGEGVSTTNSRYVEARSENDLNFDVYTYSCDIEGRFQRCSGLYLVAEFDLGSESNVAAAVNLIEYAALDDFAEGQSLKASRYLILDGGVSHSNLITNIEVFLTLAHETWEKLSDANYFKE